MIDFSMVMHFLGGLGLFLYGVNTTSGGLQKIAANKLKDILGSITKNRWAATLFGVAMTVALQSSTATTVMVVEFVNSGLMTLAQALGVALGSTLGSSLVVQLISFPILDFALLLIFVGFILVLVVKTQLTRQIGQTMIGFGCVFVGMSYLSGAFAPLKNSPEVYQFLGSFASNPVLGVLISVALASLIQSSAATIAILITLSGHGLLTISAAIPMVMGAQIGGTVATLISSLSAERVDAKRVAIANSVYRVTATIILVLLLPFFAKLVLWSSGEITRQVANAQLFSALFMVLFFLPLNPYLAKVLTKLIPQGKRESEVPALVYITKGALEVPELALRQADKEIRWVGHKILDHMLQLIPRMFASGDQRWLTEMEKAEKQIDWHYEQTAQFLKRLYWKNMTQQQIVENHALTVIAKELEAIADSLIVMGRHSYKMHHEKLEILDKDWAVLEDLYIATSENYLNLLRWLESKDEALAGKVLAKQEKISKAYNIFQGNMQGLVQSGKIVTVEDMSEEGWPESFSREQKAVLEFGNWLYKIGEHIAGIVKVFKYA